MKAKITRRLLDAPKAIMAGEVWDAGDGACPGFYARHRGREGSRWRFSLKYRIGGMARHHGIGEDGAMVPADVAEDLGLAKSARWSPEAARREAERIRGLVRHGNDPDAARGIPTVRQFAVRFMREHMAVPLRKARTVEEYQKLLDKHLLPAVGDYRLDKLDLGAVTRLVREKLKATPVSANRALAVLSSMYSRAVEWGVVPPYSNPVAGVPRFPETRRERFLSIEELSRLGDALRAVEVEGKVSPFATAAVRILVFTGARPSEITRLLWDHVDVARGLLNLPTSKTGGSKTIHLSAPARKILAELPRIAGDKRVFPPHKRKAPVIDLETAWRTVRVLADLNDVRLYDAARHSFASLAVAGGASLYLVGGLLGHKKPSTTARYAHLSADPLRAVNDAVGAQLEAAFNPKPTKGKASPLRMRGRR